MNPLLEAIRAHARRRPGAVALAGDHSRVTYRELERAVEDTAQLVAGATLGILLDNDPAWVVADLAAMAGGAVTVPLPPFFSTEQLQHVIATAGVNFLLTGDAASGRALMPGAEMRLLRVAGTALFGARTTVKEAGLHAGATKISFTSGTTGRPKGAVLPDTGQMRVAESLVMAIGAGVNDRSLSLLPLAILLENMVAYATLLAGGTMCLPSLRNTGVGLTDVDAAALLRCLDCHRPSAIALVPHVLRALVSALEREPSPGPMPRFAAVGGAPAGGGLLRRALAAGIPVYEGYGLTEATSVTTLNLPGNNRAGSVGRPLPHARVLVDQRGQIHVGGTLFSGYLGSEPRARDLHASGDLGHLDDDGFLHVDGRLKDIIVLSNGRNVSPEWVEGCLLERNTILQAAVFGHGAPHPVALLVPRPGADADAPARAVAEANRRLPAYARIGNFALCCRPLSPLHGEITGNGRLRRDRIAANFATTLQSLLPEDVHAVL